jgi:hypothetical protein
MRRARTGVGWFGLVLVLATAGRAEAQTCASSNTDCAVGWACTAGSGNCPTGLGIGAACAECEPGPTCNAPAANDCAAGSCAAITLGSQVGLICRNGPGLTAAFCTRDSDCVSNSCVLGQCAGLGVGSPCGGNGVSINALCASNRCVASVCTIAATPAVPAWATLSLAGGLVAMGARALQRRRRAADQLRGVR